jgi:hypothetical protein
VWHFEDAGRKLLASFQYSVCSRGAIRAGRLEGAWVEKEGMTMTMADRPMGVAINDAIGFRENVPQRLFNVRTLVGAMGKADGEATKSKEVLFGKTGANGSVAHIAADRMDGFAGKGIDDTRSSEITGMDDDIAGMETGTNLLQKTSVKGTQMGIRKNPSVNHFGVWMLFVGHHGVALYSKRPLNTRGEPHLLRKSLKLQEAVAKMTTVP